MLSRIGAFFLDILQVVIFAGAIFLVLYLLVMQPHKIKGASMEPNFHDGEYLLTDKITYRFNQPKRGDVIIFKAPGESGDDFIKRIIGLPGEKVSLTNGKVYIDGKILSESYIPADFVTSQGIFLQEGKEVVVPSNQFFVFGDNRSHSADSRSFGFIEKSRITGRAWFLYWPIKNLGLVEGVSY
ncbi:signal peptidase I [Candidatus Woesebacteria bacterium GWB1_43_5]|uniref:Signal peptidase I n=1 Tax=Candidatus Woesebacteria bacterium GWB1_43_5 TaxID=1802474 RepID=A0A1F7WR89_9BACT|nr:MAG: signal peptidase I [Candidatus Woesebacteria bacterium GWB1_43_5]